MKEEHSNPRARRMLQRNDGAPRGADPSASRGGALLKHSVPNVVDTNSAQGVSAISIPEHRRLDPGAKPGFSLFGQSLDGGQAQNLRLSARRVLWVAGFGG
jgi:hypothetical protein